jgi:NAD(P)-dependent dehydrogenase (short-subunit alcohol dehydrogenase family)
MSIRFDDRVVIVTGSGRGLGRAHALGFARLGAHVVINDLGGAVDGSGASDAAAGVVDEIRRAGGSAIANGVNITDRGAVGQLVEETLAAFGRVDILVNNAGILRDRSFAKMTEAEWDAVVAVHLEGTANVTRAVWPIMREQTYGRIVMTTSSTSLYGNFGQANYGAAKLGVVGLMTTLKQEGRKYDIRVNAIVPAAHTRMTEGVFPKESAEALHPELVTPGVLFLASEDAPTGAILSAGGGAFAAVRIEETPGVMIGDAPTVDDVAAEWDRIADFSRAGPIDTGFDHTLKYIHFGEKVAT